MTMMDFMLELAERPPMTRLVDVLERWFDDMFWPIGLRGRIGDVFFDVESYPSEQRLAGAPWTGAIGPDPGVMDLLRRETADSSRVVDVWIIGGLAIQDPRGDIDASPVHAARFTATSSPVCAFKISSDPGVPGHYLDVVFGTDGFPLGITVPTTDGHAELVQSPTIHAANRQRVLDWLSALPPLLDFVSPAHPRWLTPAIEAETDEEWYALSRFNEQLEDQIGPLTAARGGWKGVFERVDSIPDIEGILGQTPSESTSRALLDALEMLPRTRSAEVRVGENDWNLELDGQEVRVWHDGGVDEDAYVERRVPARALYVQAIETARRAGLDVEADDRLERLWFALWSIENGVARP